MSLSGVWKSILCARTIGLCAIGAGNGQEFSHLSSTDLGELFTAVKQEL